MRLGALARRKRGNALSTTGCASARRRAHVARRSWAWRAANWRPRLQAQAEDGRAPLDDDAARADQHAPRLAELRSKDVSSAATSAGAGGGAFGGARGSAATARTQAPVRDELAPRARNPGARDRLKRRARPRSTPDRGRSNSSGALVRDVHLHHQFRGKSNGVRRGSTSSRRAARRRGRRARSSRRAPTPKAPGAFPASGSARRHRDAIRRTPRPRQRTTGFSPWSHRCVVRRFDAESCIGVTPKEAAAFGAARACARVGTVESARRRRATRRARSRSRESSRSSFSSPAGEERATAASPEGKRRGRAPTRLVLNPRFDARRPRVATGATAA